MEILTERPEGMTQEYYKEYLRAQKRYIKKRKHPFYISKLKPYIKKEHEDK